jgi:hypothetical protein
MCYRKDYYLEGDQVYSELNVHDAYGELQTPGNPKKTVFFRGYSASHFRFAHPYHELL